MGLARYGLLAVAMAIMFGGVLVTPEPPSWWQFALALGAVVLAQQLVLFLRVGAAVLRLSWGEAALIIGLVLVPAGWLPGVFVLGAVLGAALRRLRRVDVSSLPVTAQTAANLGISAAAGAAVGSLVARLYPAPLTAATAVGLVCAAVGYLLTATVLSSLLSALRYRMDPRRLLQRALQRKALMFAGNVTFGLTVIAFGYADWRLLIVLAPAAWLLHRTYANRLRASEHRRMWGAFAQATRAFNQPDQAAVALAGIHGAREVFAVGRVEVALGGRRLWVGERTGEVRELTGPPAPAPDPCLAAPAVVPLLAGPDEIGQLRVHFPRVAGPGSGEDAALQAYGDALAAAVQDATTHQQLHHLLARAVSDAQHDPLTGLLNRAALLAHGETAVQLARHTAPVALLVVDIDHFREINDTLGHTAGDEVLRVAAQRLRAASRPGELLSRLGGDEFALLATDLPDLPPRSAAAPLRRARELVDRLTTEADIGGVRMAIGVTVGVVMAPAGTVDLTELLRRADTARFQARRGRGETVGRYDNAQDAHRTDRPALLAELRSALNRDDELVLVLHPVVDLATGAATELEALVRWRHPRRGLLLPCEFVRVVENSDLLARFTEYVVDRALAAAVRQGRHGRAVPVAVNLSARSLLDPRLPETVAALLRKHQVPGRRLVLEITETVVASELPGIVQALAGLRSLGVRLAVDDFGTGHASLTFLARVPLDQVKVHGAFVAEMDSSPEAAAIVRTTVELGRELGLRVVAEGVETAAQRRRLRALGCTAAQGFHLAEPVPDDAVADLLPAASVTGG